jgi:lysine-specific histone demethylase 1
MESIHFGLLDKIGLVFPETWWSKVPDSFYLFTREFGERGLVWIVNQGKMVDRPLLVCHLAAGLARNMEKMSDEEVTERIMRVLRDNFRNASIPDPLQTIVTRWEQDPFALGSYTHIRVGPGTKKDFDILGTPVLHPSSKKTALYFAGEHTIAHHFATAHGAYLSGVREGHRILKEWKEVNAQLH